MLLHSFEFKEAENAFSQAEVEDPGCTIAAWGLALAETERSGATARKEVLVRGWAQLQPWLAKPSGSDREQKYLNAVRAMYEGYEQVSGEVRWTRYLERMNSLRTAYPDDENASLFYCLGLVWTAGHGDSGLAQRRKALDILLPLFDRHPNNPGAAHYIIHAADAAELAAVALPAARKYATIAPDSPHALHMPSHIFNRVGDWPDSIKSNLASARVAEEWMKSGRDASGDEAHALNNLEYAYLQLGQRDNARQTMGRVDRLSTKPGSDAWLSIDARLYFDVDTHDWNDALAIEPPPNSPFKENFDVYWIHTVAAAHLAKSDEAARSLEQFRRASADWIPDHGWGDVLHLALVEAEACTLFSQGKRDEALKELATGAEFERSHPMYLRGHIASAGVRDAGRHAGTNERTIESLLSV